MRLTRIRPHLRQLEKSKRNVGDEPLHPGQHHRDCVHAPAKDAAGVLESGRPASKSEGVKFLRIEDNAAVYAVGSGI